MIGRFITYIARREFARVMKFDEKGKNVVPGNATQRSRLLYVHVPFCKSLCPYCSFNRVIFDESLCRRYFRALKKEMLLYKKKGFDFSGMYVGGGSPTVLLDDLEDTLRTASEYFDINEISVETNPDDLTKDNLAMLKKMNINRLSVGVQSFDDDLLKAMGRYDKYGSGREIAERLRLASGHFDTLNADMIFNFPAQTAQGLERDIDILKDIGIDQVTYYPLMVSDSTKQDIEKTLGPVDHRSEEALYHLISKRFASDYISSSAWCFSLKDAMVDEYIVNYDEYAGLGSGSIGYMNGMCYANTFDISDYINRLEKDVFPVEASHKFKKKDQIRYDLIMKLFGMKLDIEVLERKYGGGIFKYLWPYMFPLVLAGVLRYRHDTVYLTDRGRYWWVVVMREFFTAVNNFRRYCLNADKTKPRP